MLCRTDRRGCCSSESLSTVISFRRLGHHIRFACTLSARDNARLSSVGDLRCEIKGVVSSLLQRAGAVSGEATSARFPSDSVLFLRGAAVARVRTLGPLPLVICCGKRKKKRKITSIAKGIIKKQVSRRNDGILTSCVDAEVYVCQRRSEKLALRTLIGSRRPDSAHPSTFIRLGVKKTSNFLFLRRTIPLTSNFSFESKLELPYLPLIYHAAKNDNFMEPLSHLCSRQLLSSAIYSFWPSAPGRQPLTSESF